MTEKRFEIDSKMYGATDIRYCLKDNANELVDGYGDEIYWGNGSTNGLKQIVNKLNELVEKNEELEHENANIMSDLDYFRTKCGSCEDGLLEQSIEIVALKTENKKLKKEKEELLYQIGRIGGNNKTCRECECFISKIKYCYMWDMEVEADDVVVACDQRKVNNTDEMMSDD